MRILRQSLLFLFFLVLLFPTVTAGEDVSSSVHKKDEKVGRVTVESQEYPLDHYKLEADIGDGIMATGDRALHSINQGVWGMNKTIASFTLYSLHELMSFDLISSVLHQAGIMSERIYEVISGTFLSLFIVIIGGTAAWRFFVNQQAGLAVKAILGALAILTVSLWFYSHVSTNINWLNDRGAELEGIASSANVLLSTEPLDQKKSFSSQEGLAILENQLFDLMVKRPYLLLNYGSTKESEINKDDPERVDRLLAIKPYTDEGKSQRKEIVEDEIKSFNNVQMTPDFSGERFGYLVVTLVSTISLSIPVLLLGVFKFLLQVWFLALIIFTGIPLVVSLIPNYSETALNHGKKIVGVLMLKAGLVLLIAVITGLVTLLYESVKVTNGVEGYAFTVFLIVITIWGLFKYRSEIFEVASTGVIQGQQVVERVTSTAVGKIGQTGEQSVEGAKRMVGKVYRHHQQKKRYEEILEKMNTRKSSKPSQIDANRRSEARHAAGQSSIPTRGKQGSANKPENPGVKASAARGADGSVINIHSFRKKETPTNKKDALAPRMEGSRPSTHRDAKESAKPTENGKQEMTNAGKLEPKQPPVKQNKLKRMGVVSGEEKSKERNPASSKKPKRMRIGKKKKE
jgi:hypothetical protein